MVISFYSWAKDLPRANDPAGDFIGDMLHDLTFPHNAEDIDEIESYLIQRNACSECLDAVRALYRRYEAEIVRPSKLYQDAGRTTCSTDKTKLHTAVMSVPEKQIGAVL